MYASVIEKSGKHSTTIVKRSFTPETAFVVLKAVDIIAWKNVQDGLHVWERKADCNGNVVHTLTVK